jgi:DNA-binding transcriptional LysR family regulator
MKVDDLDLFLRVLDAGSFTHGAKVAGIGPSVASRRIGCLEAELGTRLLHRTTRAVSPTEAGRDFAERIRPSVLALRDAALELVAGEDEVSGTVRIAVPGALGRRRVAPILFDLVARHERLRVDLLVSDARVGLVEEGIDLAVRVGLPRDSSLVARKLGVSPQAFVAAPTWVGRAATLGPGLRVVLRLEPGIPQDLAQLGLRGDWTVALASDDVETVARAIVAGIGVGMLPEWLVADELQSGALVRLPAPFEVPPAQIVALLPSGRQTSRRVRVVLDALVAAFL